MTLPFFGAGIVELPPGGFKHSKNSRKMQMVFFVHQGKVMVDVGGTGADQKRADTNKFAISKGGVWVVPRGKPTLSCPFASHVHSRARLRALLEANSRSHERAVTHRNKAIASVNNVDSGGVCATSRSNNAMLHYYTARAEQRGTAAWAEGRAAAKPVCCCCVTERPTDRLR